jgi:hypothetical protein
MIRLCNEEHSQNKLNWAQLLLCNFLFHDWNRDRRAVMADTVDQISYKSGLIPCSNCD